MHLSNNLMDELRRILTAPTSLVKIRTDEDLKQAGELIARYVLIREIRKHEEEQQNDE